MVPTGEGGEQPALPGREPALGDHLAGVPLVVDGRQAELLVVVGEQGVAVQQVQVHPLAGVAVAEEVADAGEHLVAGGLGRQGDVQPAVPAVGQEEGGLGLALAHRRLDEDLVTVP
jgi:hypothetical protein